MKKINFLGAGSWASALAVPLTENNVKVQFYTNSLEQINKINKRMCNDFSFDFPVHFKKGYVSATDNLEEFFKDCEVLVMCVPSSVIKLVLINIIPHVKKPIVFLNTVKGFVSGDGCLVSDFLYQNIDHNYIKAYASLLGPSHAEELARRKNTFVNLATANKEIGTQLIDMFSQNYFRLFYSPDCKGCELGAVVKNLFAIGNGILTGADYGINTIAYYVYLVINEIKTLLKLWSYNLDNIFNLSWVGDYIVTAFSKFSRNFSFGYDLAKTNNVQKSLKNFEGITVEGIDVAKIIYKKLKKHQDDFVIIPALYDVLTEKIDVKAFVNRIF